MMEQPRNCPFCHKCSVEWPVYLDEIHQFNADISPEVMYHLISLNAESVKHGGNITKRLPF